MKHTPNSTAKIRRWTVTRTPQPEALAPEPSSADAADGIRFGYTLDDLDRLARRVVTAHLGWWGAGDRHDQYETAWSGIAEHLCAVTGKPTERDLTAAGTHALDLEVKATQRHHGSDRAGGVGPRYAAYWYEPPATPWEERLIDRIAAAQVLAAVGERDRRAVTMLAATGDRKLTARALALTDTALTARLCRARAVCRQHWYAPDTAPPMKRPPSPGRVPQRTQCAEGHELTPDNIAWSAPKRPGRPRYGRCRECERERSRRRVAAKREAAAA